MKKEIYVTGTKAKGCTYWAVAVLAVLMTFMEMSGLPSALCYCDNITALRIFLRTPAA
jgi:hypothetical protein